MSRNGFIVLGFIVIIVLIIGALYFMHAGSTTGNPNTTSGVGLATPASTTPSGDTTTLPSGSSTSDAALQTDLASIDSQMANFGSDASSANDSVAAEQNNGTSD